VTGLLRTGSIVLGSVNDPTPLMSTAWTGNDWQVSSAPVVVLTGCTWTALLGATPEPPPPPSPTMLLPTGCTGVVVAVGVAVVEPTAGGGGATTVKCC